MRSLYLFPLLVVASCYQAFAQTHYFDAAIFDLKGPVKECVVLANDYYVSDPQYVFREDGSLIYAKGFSGDTVRMKIARDKNGYITSSIKEKNIGLLEYLFGGFQKQDTTYYAYADGRVAYTITTEGYVQQYIYNDCGDMIRSMEGPDESDYWAYVRIYSEIEKDCYGNWTKRKVSDENNEFLKYEQRKITYWRDCSKIESLPEQEKFVEPDRELSINDMIYKVLGVVDVADGNIWSLNYQQVLEEARRRENWEVTINSFSTGIYGNCNYGKKKQTGYNLTYHGEPLFSVGFNPGYGAKEVECFSFSFHRDIKGKKANKQHGTNALAWASDNEAKAFANIIVSELEAATGLKMEKTKNMKRDIYTMAAYDKRTFYKVRVFKHNGKYSSFYMVSLEMYRSNSWHNTLLK